MPTNKLKRSPSHALSRPDLSRLQILPVGGRLLRAPSCEQAFYTPQRPKLGDATGGPMRPSARKVLKVGLKGWPEVRCGASFSAKSRTEMATFFAGTS